MSWFKSKRSTNLTVQAQEPVKELRLADVFDVVKHGRDIGLDAKVLHHSDSMEATLKFEHVLITITEWAEWTVCITLTNGETHFCVYQSPGLKVSWHDLSIGWATPSSKPLHVEWDERGEWCQFTRDSVEEFRALLKNKRAEQASKAQQAKAKADAEQVRELAEKKEMFNELFRNKS